ncbi:MAG: DUF4097 domain-containing protein [Candidatus Aminicenantes bacterium]|nr:DUF4097 domain-containing protein [Candidatus Aminicenantes bacterium]
MTKQRSAKIFTLLLVVLSASCIYVVVEDPQAAGRLMRPRLEKSLPFPADGVLAVEAENAEVEIRGWDQEEISLVAEEDRPVPSGPRVFGTWDNEPDVEIDRTGDRLLIRAGFSGEGETQVRLVLRVPRSLRVRGVDVREGTILLADFYGEALIRLETGDLRVENYSGSLDARVGEGDIVAEFLDVREEDEVRLLAADGDITLTLEENVRASLDAGAAAGEITSELDLKIPLPAGEAKAELGGGGGGRIELRAEQGSIHIQKSKGSEDV